MRGLNVRTVQKQNVDDDTFQKTSVTAAAASQPPQQVSTESTAAFPASNPFLKGLRKPSSTGAAHAGKDTTLTYAHVVGMRTTKTQPPKFDMQKLSHQFHPASQQPSQQTNFNPFLAKHPAARTKVANTRSMPHLNIDPIAGGQPTIPSSFLPPYDDSSGGVSSNPLYLPSHFTALPQQRSGRNLQAQTVSPGQFTVATALHLKAVPPHFNNEAFLKNHFSPFGSVTSIKCNAEKMYATVSFTTHVSASCRSV